jgi:hypothetical protein
LRGKIEQVAREPMRINLIVDIEEEGLNWLITFVG